MTEDETDRLALAKALSTQAGMLFEDASAQAVMVGHLSADELHNVLRQISRANERAESMLNAAATLLSI